MGGQGSGPSRQVWLWLQHLTEASSVSEIFRPQHKIQSSTSRHVYKDTYTSHSRLGELLEHLQVIVIGRAARSLQRCLGGAGGEVAHHPIRRNNPPTLARPSLLTPARGRRPASHSSSRSSVGLLTETPLLQFLGVMFKWRNWLTILAFLCRWVCHEEAATHESEAEAAWAADGNIGDRRCQGQQGFARVASNLSGLQPSSLLPPATVSPNSDGYSINLCYCSGYSFRRFMDKFGVHRYCLSMETTALHKLTEFRLYNSNYIVKATGCWFSKKRGSISSSTQVLMYKRHVSFSIPSSS